MAGSIAGKIRRIRRMATGDMHTVEPHERPERFALASFDRAAELAKSKTDLERAFWSHDGRLIHKWLHYLPIHDRYLGPLRKGFPDGKGGLRPLRLLEIGVSGGGSLELWRKFLGPGAVIFGVDIDPRCAELDSPKARVRIGSQDDPVFLKGVVAEMGGLDVVIDDGSHQPRHQRASFDALFGLLSEGGLYIVEDTQTSYWDHWDGGFRKQGSLIEIAKSVVDDMHGWYHKSRIERPMAQTEVGSVAFHDGIVVIEKRHRERPASVHLGRDVRG